MGPTLESMVADALHEIRTKKDDLLFAAFEKYGYSREWIMNPDNMKRITVYGNANDPAVTVWTVDGIPLFELIREIEWEGLNAKFDIIIRYIAEVE